MRPFNLNDSLFTPKVELNKHHNDYKKLIKKMDRKIAKNEGKIERMYQ